MTEASVWAIVQSLNTAGVKYLVVGGLAVNAHGYVRNTQDIDLLVGLDRENLLAALRVLKELKYVPKVPVKIEDFADPATRESWIREKHMVVFGLRSNDHKETDVDLFVNDPIGFDEAYNRKYIEPLEQEILRAFDPQYSPSFDDPADEHTVLNIPFCSYEDLVKLKVMAGRARDLDDLERLRIVRGEE
jgi:predicted nucleotidyltransferase